MMLKSHDSYESYETPFLLGGNTPKLFCSFRVGLKSALYGTSKFLALYFCEALLKIVLVNRSMRNVSKNIYSRFDKNKRKAVNRILLRYS